MLFRRHLLAFGLLACLWPEAAGAHALLLSSDPTAGAAVGGPDIALTLRYNSRVDADRSRLTLNGPDGKSRPLAVGRGESPSILASRADGLSAGRYTLRWEVLSVDGHISRGDLPFSVAVP